MRFELRLPLATGPMQKRIHGISQQGSQLGGGRRGLLLGRQRADRVDRQSNTSGNGNYCNCGKIFDPHGDGYSVGPTTGHSPEMVPERASDLVCNRGRGSPHCSKRTSRCRCSHRSLQEFP